MKFLIALLGSVISGSNLSSVLKGFMFVSKRANFPAWCTNMGKLSKGIEDSQATTKSSLKWLVGLFILSWASNAPSLFLLLDFSFGWTLSFSSEVCLNEGNNGEFLTQSFSRLFSLKRLVKDDYFIPKVV